MPAGYVRFNFQNGQAATDAANLLKDHLQKNFNTTLAPDQLKVGVNARGGACLDLAESCPTSCIDEVTTILELNGIKPLYWKTQGTAQGAAAPSATASTTAHNQPAHANVVSQLNQMLQQAPAMQTSAPPTQVPIPTAQQQSILTTPPAVPTTPKPTSSVFPPHAAQTSSSTSYVVPSEPLQLTFNSYGISGATSGLVSKLNDTWGLDPADNHIVATGPGQIEVSAQVRGVRGIMVKRAMDGCERECAQQWEQNAIAQLGDYGESYDNAKNRIDAECGINKKTQKADHEEIKDYIKLEHEGEKPKYVRFADELAVMDRFDANHGRGNHHGEHLQRLLDQRNQAQSADTSQSR